MLPIAPRRPILVAGFDAQNKEKAVATYTLTPASTQLTSAPMIQAVLPSGFTGLHNVTMIQSSPARQVLKVDNVKYKTYSTWFGGQRGCAVARLVSDKRAPRQGL